MDWVFRRIRGETHFARKNTAEVDTIQFFGERRYQRSLCRGSGEKEKKASSMGLLANEEAKIVSTAKQE